MPQWTGDIPPEQVKRNLAGSFPGDLGIEPLALSDDEVVGRMVVDRRHLHPGGYVHGGAWVALADSVAAWGTMRHLGPDEIHTTIELKINLLTAGRDGEELVATGRPLHLGRTTQVWEVEVHNGRRLAAAFTCTQIVLSNRGSA